MSDEVIVFPDDRRELNQRIYHYKRAGESFDEIAERLNLGASEVIRGYRNYMKEIVAEYSLHEREHIVAMELDRLDQLMQPFYIAGTQGEKEGAEVYLKIAAHRAKLLRLDQPTPDELRGQTQVIVVTGSKEEFEQALKEGQMRQVTGPDRDDGDEEEAT
jgi:hypothetical protein